MRTKRRKRKRRKKRVERKNRSSVLPFFFPFSLLLVYTLFVLFFFSECSDYLSRFSEPSVLLFIQRSNATNAYPNISIPSIDLKA